MPDSRLLERLLYGELCQSKRSVAKNPSKVNALECFLWTVPLSEGKSSHRGPEQMRHAQANMVESRLKKNSCKGLQLEKKILHSQKAKKKKKKNHARFSDSLSIKGYIRYKKTYYFSPSVNFFFLVVSREL